MHCLIGREPPTCHVGGFGERVRTRFGGRGYASCLTAQNRTSRILTSPSCSVLLRLWESRRRSLVEDLRHLGLRRDHSNLQTNGMRQDLGRDALGR